MSLWTGRTSELGLKGALTTLESDMKKRAAKKMRRKLKVEAIRKIFAKYGWYN